MHNGHISVSFLFTCFVCISYLPGSFAFSFLKLTSPGIYWGSLCLSGPWSSWNNLPCILLPSPEPAYTHFPISCQTLETVFYTWYVQFFILYVFISPTQSVFHFTSWCFLQVMSSFLTSSFWVSAALNVSATILASVFPPLTWMNCLHYATFFISLLL